MEISRANGLQVDTIIGDAAYSGKENLQLQDKDGQRLKLVAKLNPAISQGTRKEQARFEYNKDAAMFVSPAGHMAVRKARQGKKNRGENQATTSCFDVQKCRSCPLREGCYKPGAKSKTYGVRIKSAEHMEQQAFQQTAYVKEKARERYKIEAENSGPWYGRAISYGASPACSCRERWPSSR